MHDLYRAIEAIAGPEGSDGAEPAAEPIGVHVSVHAQPGAGRTEIVGRHGDALKVRVAVPPERGKANEAIIALLADKIGVKPTAVTIESGEASRTKRFRVDGVDVDTAVDALEEVLSHANPGRNRR